MSEFEDKLSALRSNPDSMAQVMKLAQSLSAGQAGDGKSPEPTRAEESPSEGSPRAENPTPAGNLFSAFGDLDPKLLVKYLPLLQEFNQSNSNTMQLLMALKPFLKEEKQEKVERAARLAKLIHIGKKFFSQWEG